MLSNGKKGIVMRSLIRIAFITLFNLISIFAGYKLEVFKLLQNLINENGAIYYEISISNFLIIITWVIVNTLSIYYGITTELFWVRFSQREANGALFEGLNRIEDHLINFDHDSIPFEKLADIERRIGATNRKISNEIWILTNNIEECHDSEEGRHLRQAIISNLKTNVNYYYVIPQSAVEDIEQLSTKLRSKTKREQTSGTFRYIVDDALDFIPTPYFDIVMYLKMTPGMADTIESSSEIYYCFSQETTSTECYYQAVKDRAIWLKMREYIKKYKNSKKSSFISILDKSEKSCSARQA